MEGNSGKPFLFFVPISIIWAKLPGAIGNTTDPCSGFVGRENAAIVLGDFNATPGSEPYS